MHTFPIFALCGATLAAVYRMPIFDGYYTVLQIGTPPQPIPVALSPGTSETWVPSVNYTEFTTKWKYNATLSSTHAGHGTVVRMSDLRGELFQDSFTIGDLILQNQTFAAYDSGETPSGWAYVMGVLGLISPFYNMVKEGWLDKPVFTLYYGNSTSGRKVTGELVFGDIDNEHYTGDLVTLPVRNEKWAVGLESVSFGSGRSMSYGENGLDATFDGSSLAFVFPNYTSDFLNEAIGTTNGQVDCNKINTFPDLTLTISGHHLTVEPRDYTLGLFGRCYSLIAGSEERKVTLGQPFLRRWYSVYDLDKKTVGLGKAKVM